MAVSAVLVEQGHNRLRYLVTNGFGQNILGAASGFAVLGASTVTSSGPTTIEGDLGLWPGSAITGFPPGTVSGTTHTTDAAAAAAQGDATAAFIALTALTPSTDLTGQNLAGKILAPGVYHYDTSADLSVGGTLTFDAQGNPNATWVIQIGSTLTANNGSIMNVINGGSGCNVFWKVGSSATIGTTVQFVGNVIALASISVNTSATVLGRLIARTGAVTLLTNDVNATACGGASANVALTTTGGATPDLVTDSLYGPIKQLARAFAQGIGILPAGAKTQAQSRAIWLADASDVVLGNGKVPRTIMTVTPRTGGGNWSIDASVDGTGHPTILITGTVVNATAYLDILTQGAIGI